MPQDFFAFLSESDDDGNGHAAIFEVKSKKKTRTTTESRERSAEQLFDILEPVALASVLLRTPLSLQQDASMTLRKSNW